MYNPELAHYIAVTAIIVRNGKYLIAKRAEWEKDFSGKWTVPGGKVEVNDYKNKAVSTEGGKQWYNVLEDAVRREVKEEVGLEVDEIGFVTNLIFMRKDGIPCMVVSLYAKSKEGEVKLDNAHVDYKWIAVEEAKDYDLIDGIAEEIMMVDEYLKTGKLKDWKEFRE